MRLTGFSSSVFREALQRTLKLCAVSYREQCSRSLRKSCAAANPVGGWLCNASQGRALLLTASAITKKVSL